MIEEVRQALAEATPFALAINVPYAIAIACVAAEVAWLARRPGERRRRILTSAGTASAMAAGAFAIGLFYTAVLTALWQGATAFRFEGAAAFWSAHPVIGALATFVAWDASGWLYHVIGHRTRIGWAAHQPHHSGEDYDATLGLRQTWLPFHGLLHHPLLAVAGFDLRVAFVCAAISNCWQVLEHTSLPIRFPRWVEAVVMTPASHRHHHGRDSDTMNLGPFFTVWDRLAGTWIPPTAPAPKVYGSTASASANPITIELAGWRALLASGRTPLLEGAGGDGVVAVARSGRGAADEGDVAHTPAARDRHAAQGAEVGAAPAAGAGAGEGEMAMERAVVT